MQSSHDAAKSHNAANAKLLAALAITPGLLYKVEICLICTGTQIHHTPPFEMLLRACPPIQQLISRYHAAIEYHPLSASALQHKGCIVRDKCARMALAKTAAHAPVNQQRYQQKMHSHTHMILHLFMLSTDQQPHNTDVLLSIQAHTQQLQTKQD